MTHADVARRHEVYAATAARLREVDVGVWLSEHPANPANGGTGDQRWFASRPGDASNDLQGWLTVASVLDHVLDEQADRNWDWEQRNDYLLRWRAAAMSLPDALEWDAFIRDINPASPPFPGVFSQTVDMARRWKERGFTAAEAQAWRNVGATAAQAERRRTVGGTLAEFSSRHRRAPVPGRAWRYVHAAADRHGYSFRWDSKPGSSRAVVSDGDRVVAVTTFDPDTGRVASVSPWRPLRHRMSPVNSKTAVAYIEQWAHTHPRFSESTGSG